MNTTILSRSTRLFSFLLLLMGLVLSTGTTFAQSLDLDLIESMKPRNIGPANMSGRITSIDVVRNDPDIIYAGSASGGLWKSESGGIDWEPIFDDNLALSIGAVAVSQKNPSIVWAGTGEGNPRNSLNGGYGVYRSLDAGKTWELMGLEETRNIHRIIIHPDDPNTVFIGAIGSPWGDHEQRGVYKTTDGGETWEKILYVDQMTGVGDMVMDPSNPNKILVNMWQHRREPWFFKSGGPSSGLYITMDGGKNWTKQTAKENGLPKGDLGRMGLAFATNDPSRGYAIIEAKDNALYRSEDGGMNWKMINDKSEIGNRPFYYFDIYVDPKNENRLYSIFTNVNVSEDGGNSFRGLIGRGLIHVDHHALYIHPDNPEYMILGNDGGMAITRDMGKTWQFVENLALGQFYHINVDNEIPYNVYGGLQDNGTYTGPAYAWVRGGLRNDYYFSVSGGDGFDVMADPDDARYGYSMSQKGNVLRYDKETGRTKGIKPIHPDPDMVLRFNWNAAIAQDPFDNSTIYFGSQFVHKSTDKGDSWEVISPDLTTNDPEKQKQHLSGGLTIDATGAENFTSLLAIEPSALEQGVLWAGSDDGLIHVTRDGGNTWTNVSKNLKGVPEGSWVAQIKASRHNKGEAVAVINNYRRFDFKPYLMHTTNYGKSWKSLADEDDVFGYALSFIQDPVEPNLMFFGTEHGLYVSIDGAKTWTKYTNGYPSVSTMDMVIQEREKDLVIGSYGRAIWVLDDITPLRVLAANGQDKVKESPVTVLEPTIAYMTTTRDGDGPANPGSSTFAGENRPSGSATIKFFAKKPEAPKKKEGDVAKGDERRPRTPRAAASNGSQAIIKISDMQGNHIREIKQPVRDGLNMVRWRFDEDVPEGTVQPPLPPGVPQEYARFFRVNGAPALPGTYNVSVTVGDQSDETQLVVKLDPRENFAMSDLIARRDMLRDILELSNEVNAMNTRVTDDIKQINKVLASLKELDGEDANAMKKRSEEIKKELEEVGKLIVDRSRGRTSDPHLTQPLQNRVTALSRSVSGSYDRPGKTQMMLKKFVDDRLVEVKREVDAWYAANWQAYMDEVEAFDFSPIDTDK